jgi:flagellar hook-associated protein 2
MSMSVDGLISGMDTTGLIQKLLLVEAGPQTALKARLKSTELAASAYRTVNTTFAAVRAAAEAMLDPASWSATKAGSSSTNVTVSSSATATPGSLTFTVDKLASAHAVYRTDPAWTSDTSPAGFSSLDLYAADGTTKTGTITVGGTGTLTDAAAAINASNYGLSATVVKTDTGTYALQVAAKKTGAANAFSFKGTGVGTFLVNNAGTNAKLTIGTGATYSVTSDTNTFTTVMPGTTITAGKADVGTPVTVSVTADPDAVAAKVQSLVDAVNSALDTTKTYTSNSKDSTAALKGDFSVSSLAGNLLDAVSFAVVAAGDDGKDRSPATVGFSLTKDGKVTFDKATFLTALKDTPDLAQRIVAGTATTPGPDGVIGTRDDVAANGVAGRLLGVAKAASDSVTGSLVQLAVGQDSMVKDIQDRIDAWDVRLAARKEALTRQFSAMETALSSLKNQSTWLAGQINSLPQG